MNLIINNWTKKDIKKFNIYLESLQNKDKINWTRNIVQTNMKVLAIKTPFLKNISKEILKGNYFSFLDHMNNDSLEAMSINSYLINNIKDFNKHVEYLDKYSLLVENWANCDSLKITIKNNEENYLNLINRYVDNKLPFVRRIGVRLLFSYIKDYPDEVFKVLNKFKNEKEYYVDMINAWILCELFIKQRDKTINYLNNNNLNKFTINKAISKCRDSFRVTKEDKEMLIKYKKKD